MIRILTSAELDHLIATHDSSLELPSLEDMVAECRAAGNEYDAAISDERGDGYYDVERVDALAEEYQRLYDELNAYYPKHSCQLPPDFYINDNYIPF